MTSFQGQLFPGTGGPGLLGNYTQSVDQEMFSMRNSLMDTQNMSMGGQFRANQGRYGL